jgi:hypothetical protein
LIFRNTNPQILGLIPQAQIRKSQIRKIPWCPILQITNPQICKAKRSVFGPDQHWFASNIFFYLFYLENTTYLSTKGGHAKFFDSPQIANPQIHGLIPQAQTRKSQIRKLPWCPSVQIANPQICKAKSSVFDPDPHWFA